MHDIKVTRSIYFAPALALAIIMGLSPLSVSAADLFASGPSASVFFNDTDNDNDADWGDEDWEVSVSGASDSLPGIWFVQEKSTNSIPVLATTASTFLGQGFLSVDHDTGYVGVGTNSPENELTITTDETVANLELDVPSDIGGGPRTWDINLGGSGLFLRDSQAFTTPVKFMNEAPSNSVVVGSNGNVGLGGRSTGNFFPDPRASLHVKASDGSGRVLVEELSGTSAARELFKLSNNGGPFFIFENRDLSESYAFAMGATGHFLVSHQQTSGIQMRLTPSGNLTIQGSLVEGSSRAIKEDITPLDGEEVLAKLEHLPVNEWSYESNRLRRHAGPMAEDFHATFGLGPDDKHIAARDVAGVALAAAKALKKENARLMKASTQKDDRISALEEVKLRLVRKVNKLGARLSALEARLGNPGAD